MRKPLASSTTFRIAAMAIVLGLGALLGVMPAAAQEPPGPVVTVVPDTVRAGDTVAVRGRGFDGDCGVNVFLDDPESSLLAQLLVDGGSFSGPVVVPADTEPGEHELIAVGLDFGVEFCGDPSGKQASTPLVVLARPPAIATSPAQATPGHPVAIDGSGFCGDPECSPVTVLIGGIVVAADVTVDPDGSFEVEVQIPAADAVGEIAIVVLQTDAEGNEIEAQSTIVLSVRPPYAEPIIRSGERRAPEAAFSVDGASSPDAVLVPRAHTPSSVSDVNPDGLPGEPRFGGRSLGLTIDPTDNSIVWVASERGGFFRSSDGGTNWTHLDEVHVPMARDIMFDPRDRDILIASGRYDGRVSNQGGIWRSIDSGASWEKPATSNPPCTSEASSWGIAIPDHPSAHVNVFVATDCGIAISDDSGASWSHVDPCTSLDASWCGSQRTYYDVEAQVVGGQIQLDVCGDEGYFRSSDGGASWSTPEPSSPARAVSGGAFNPCRVTTAPNDPQTVYLTNYSGTTPSGFCQARLMESEDGGANWLSMDVGGQNCRDPWVVTHPDQGGDPDLFEVYYGDAVRMRKQTCDRTASPRCTTGAAAWPTADSGAHADTSDIAFDTSIPNGCPLVMSNDGGIATSADCGATWQDGNRGLHALDVVTFAGTVNGGGATDLYAGTQDNGIYVSQDAAATWTRPVGADGYNVLADRTAPARVFYRRCFGCSDFIANPGLAGAVAFPDPPGTVPTFAVATQFGPQSYAFLTNDGGSPAQWTAWVTTDEGASWDQLGPSPLPGSPGEIKSAGPAASPTFYLRLAVGGARRLYRLSGALDATATLVPADSGLSVPSNAWDVDPSDPLLLYANDVGTDRMMFSVDGGMSWDPDDELTELVTRGGEFRFDPTTFPALVSGVAFDPNGPTILVGTRTAGIFVSVTDGEAWLPVPGAERIPLAEEFFFDTDTDGIFAATRGRGIWRIDLPEADLSVTKTDLPDPVAAGTELVYTLTVANDGPDTATHVRVVDTLPDVVAYVSDTASGGCVEAPAGTLTCDVGDLVAAANAVFTVTVAVAADAVYEAGAPFTMTNDAETRSDVPDSSFSDNAASEDTDVFAEADLEIVSFEAIDPPDEILVGEEVEVTLRKEIRNNGPSGPIDVTLTATALGSPGVTIVPANPVIEEDALGLDEQRVVDEVYTLSCQEFSQHSFTIDNEIAPRNAADVDPDLGNNAAQVTIDVECVLPVAINIKPGSDPNSTQPFSKGVIPVAVLTTEPGEYGLPLAVDATLIDPLSVRFGPPDVVEAGGGAPEQHGKGHYEDSYELDEETMDGDIDLVLHFKTPKTGIEPDDVEACVKGTFYDEEDNPHTFLGCDTLRIVPAVFASGFESGSLADWSAKVP